MNFIERTDEQIQACRNRLVNVIVEVKKLDNIEKKDNMSNKYEDDLFYLTYCQKVLDKAHPYMSKETINVMLDNLAPYDHYIQ